MVMQELEWEDCLIPPRRDRGIERAYRERLGVVPHATAYMSLTPWIAHALLDLTPANGVVSELDLELCELACLAVSQDNSCRYCFAAHRALLRIQGFGEARIRRLEQSAFAADLEPARQVALDFARRLSRSNPILHWDDTQRLREAGWSDAAVKEIAFVAASMVFANRVATLTAIPPMPVERDPDRPLWRLLRPLIARRLRARLSRGRPRPLPPEMRSGPFQHIVEALAPLPAAHVLRGILDRAFRSTVLPERARALVFGVVARGLGCPLSEREAVRLLHGAGMSEPATRRALDHLASAELDDLEAAVISLVRDTIRYSEAAPLQRRARSLRDRIGVEVFGEIVGIVGLANMVCRLSFVTEAP